jgi:pimeloyl-ACP methyl ester carboxylesterase
MRICKSNNNVQMKLRQKLAVAYIRTKFKLLAAVSKKKAAVKAFDLFCTPQFRNVKELPAIFKEAERLRFKFREYAIVGYRWNKGASHKVLIIHGFESSVVNFDKYASAFIKKGYEVLAFDAPAHGLSSGKRINALIYRDFIKYICQQYGPVHSFMAHSFGGLALCMALAEISNNENDRVVLVAPATETKTALDQFFKFIRLPDVEVRKEFDEIITTMSGHSVAWFSIRRALRKIKAKILWLHDKDDKITPLKDVLPVKEENYLNIQFVITKGLGHRKIYRDANVGKAIVNFISMSPSQV